MWTWNDLHRRIISNPWYEFKEKEQITESPDQVRSSSFVESKKAREGSMFVTVHVACNVIEKRIGNNKKQEFLHSFVFYCFFWRNGGLCIRRSGRLRIRRCMVWIVIGSSTCRTTNGRCHNFLHSIQTDLLQRHTTVTTIVVVSLRRWRPCGRIFIRIVIVGYDRTIDRFVGGIDLYLFQY